MTFFERRARICTRANRDQPRTRAERRAPRQDGGAGLAGRTADDEQVAVGSLVRILRARCDEGREVILRPQSCRGRSAHRNPDIDDPYFARMLHAGILVKAALLRREGDRERCTRRHAENRARVGVETTRQIERHDGCWSRFHDGDGFCIATRHGTIETRAKEAVDDERRVPHVRAKRLRVFRRQHHSLDSELTKKHPVRLRVAPKPRRVAHEYRQRLVTQQGQSSRDNPRVAAVLPRSADEHDAVEAVVEHLADRIARTAPCVLHQHEADNPKLVDRDAIDLA